MIKDDISGYIFSLKSHGEPVPPGIDGSIEKIEVVQHSWATYGANARRSCYGRFSLISVVGQGFPQNPDVHRRGAIRRPATGIAWLGTEFCQSAKYRQKETDTGNSRYLAEVVDDSGY